MRVLHMIEAAQSAGQFIAGRVAPSIPWSAVVGMKHRRLHGYLDLNTEILWKTVAAELPTLLPELPRLVHGSAAPP